MDPQELEAGHSLHRGSIDVDGWMGVSIPPEVHDELFCFVDVEQQVVVVALRSQAIHLLPILRLFLMRPITVVSSTNLIMVLEPCTGLQSWVKRE